MYLTQTSLNLHLPGHAPKRCAERVVCNGQRRLLGFVLCLSMRPSPAWGKQLGKNSGTRTLLSFHVNSYPCCLTTTMRYVYAYPCLSDTAVSTVMAGCPGFGLRKVI